MNKNSLIVITMGLSFGLVGCSGLMYSNTPAPVYNISSANNSRPATVTKTVPVTNTAPVRPASIEQLGTNNVVVDNSQNNPYVQQPTVQRPNAVNEKTTELIDSAKAAATNDPRVKEANEVLVNTQQKVDQTKTAVQTARPTAVQNAQIAATNAVKTTTNAVNSATGTATAAATAAVATTRPKPATPQSATKSLLQEARSAVAAGNFDKAASALERAHRIEPGNAKILYDIAQIRYAQGKYRQASSFASKAANYTKSPSLSKKIWTILAKARKALGNSSGAAAAAQKAASF